MQQTAQGGEGMMEGAEEMAVERKRQAPAGERTLGDGEEASDTAEPKQASEKEAAGEKTQEVSVSVRRLVEFILRHGDIDNRKAIAPENAMQEGSRVHRMIQRRMGAEYQAEVPLKMAFPADEYVLIVEGRADGIIQKDGQVTIDEIKGTYRDLARMKAPMPLHAAQAKCYAYLYGKTQGLKSIRIRLTYCHMPSGEIRYFHEEHDFGGLEAWFEGLLAAYRKWSDYWWKWQGIRSASIRTLEFPYPYREGQKDLAASVYRTIYHKKKLFLEAPTGVGKTISTVYPAVQAMGKGMGEKLFYLTAKTITRTVAEETMELLREKGLRMKSITLTAKEKICFMEETECNPQYCPYARGHYDRVNDAVFDMLTCEERFDRDTIAAYAQKHMVCPFEMCLDASLFSDAVICDYNYLFDPHVYLKRFFGEGVTGDYLFLIDEAHNLLERGREMYSAVLQKEDFVELRKELKKTLVSGKGRGKKKEKKADVSGQMTLEALPFLTDVSQEGEAWEIDCEPVDQTSTAALSAAGAHAGRSVLFRQGYAEKLCLYLDKCNRQLLSLKRQCEDYCIVESIEEFVESLMRLQTVLEDYLEEQEEGELPIRDILLDFYFEVSHFFTIYELLDENYVKYAQLCDDGSFLIKLLCVNPKENLKRCMLKGRSAILFSATLLPIQYYKGLLGGEPWDYEIYARSVFSPARRALLVASDVTSKYTRRSEDEYGNIARYIEEIVKNRHGNYMVFCPSHAFLRAVHDRYADCYGGEERECILQGESMGEAQREAFLERFRQREDKGGEAERMLIGFCVLGGIFSEGIDLKRDGLIGAMIVGTGLPQVSAEREILKDYFDRTQENGFDYAYRYPGMNKVLQAAGRVIRTAQDVGIVALLDERFLQPAYRRLFPREWDQFETVTVNTVAKRVERFWNEWL